MKEGTMLFKIKPLTITLSDITLHTKCLKILHNCFTAFAVRLDMIYMESYAFLGSRGAAAFYTCIIITVKYHVPKPVVDIPFSQPLSFFLLPRFLERLPELQVPVIVCLFNKLQ